MSRSSHKRRTARALTLGLLIGLAASTVVVSQPQTGDVFSHNTPGGVPGEPAIDQYGRDPECGGTNRTYYDQMYGVEGHVVSVPQMQEDYREGKVIRCGACGDNAICWEKDANSGGPLRGRAEQNDDSGAGGGYSYPAPVPVYPGAGSRPTPSYPPANRSPPPNGYTPPAQNAPPPIRSGQPLPGSVRARALQARANSVALLGGAAGGCAYSGSFPVLTIGRL